ncbi:MAG: hypothetical protein ACI8Q1_000242 [Parvicella sp.]|jgi:hypothetical protein
MVIDKKHAIHLSDQYIPQCIDDFVKKSAEIYKKEVSRTLTPIKSNDETFLFTDSACRIADKILVNKRSYKSLSFIPDGRSRTIGVHSVRNACFRYYKEEEVLTVIGVSYAHNPDKSIYVDYAIFRVDTVTGDRHLGINQAFDDEDEIKLASFVSAIIFIELAEIETVKIKPNQKIGKTKKTSIVNSGSTEFVVVRSSWNKEYTLSGSFDVSGHFRMQPCGKGMLDRKLIFIKPFSKNGYHRKSNKESYGKF